MPARHRIQPVRTAAIPKPGGGNRLLAHLGPRDAAAWEALGERVRRLVERRLAPGAVADGGGTLGTRLAHARTAGGRLAERIEVVTTDVRAFYPSVDPGVLFRTLTAVGADPGDASHAAAMTEGWGSEGAIRGLPIGPPSSAILANAVLVSVDEALPRPFLRWVDDYLLPAGALDRFDEALDGVGLTRSAEKTHPGRTGVWAQGGPPAYDDLSPCTR